MNSIEVACYLCLSSNIALLKTCLSHLPVICVSCMTRDVPDTCLYPGCMRPYRYQLPEAAAVVAPLPRQPQPQARNFSVINEDLTWTMTALAELRELRELMRVPASADAFEDTGSAASLLLRAQSRRLGRRRRLVVGVEAAPAAAEAAPVAPAAAPAAAAAAPAAADDEESVVVVVNGRRRKRQRSVYKNCRYCATPFWYHGACISHEQERCPRRPRSAEVV